MNKDNLVSKKKKSVFDWEKFCTYQDLGEEQEKIARAGPKLKYKIYVFIKT